MINFFHVILYQPLINILLLIYKFTAQDFGLAVIVLTILIRLALLPLTKKSITAQKAMSSLSPKIQALKEKHKDNKEAQTKALMELYQKEKISPFSGCLPILIQLPILWTLYNVLISSLKTVNASDIYPFLSNFIVSFKEPYSFLGLVNMATPNIFLAFLAGVLQLIQSYQMVRYQNFKSSGPSDIAASLNKNMTFILPIMTFFISWKLPAALALYWATTTLISIFQQLYIVYYERKNKIAN